MRGRPAGFKHTEQTRKLIAAANVRNGHFSAYNKTRSSVPGYVNPMKEKKRPDLSAWNKKANRGGENNPNWKGGVNPLLKTIRHLFQYRQWRSDVFTRDEFTCQDCGVNNCALEAHHIVRFIEIINLYDIKSVADARACEKLWDINNGQTLCETCHDKTRTRNVPLS